MASKWNTHITDGPPEQRREKQRGRNNFSISFYAEDGTSWKMETTRGKNPTLVTLKKNLTDALNMLVNFENAGQR